jgi:hypothetical protein
MYVSPVYEVHMRQIQTSYRTLVGMGAVLFEGTRKIANAVFDLVRATYETMSKTINDASIQETDHIVFDPKEGIENSFNELSHIRTTNVDSDLRYLMMGGELDGKYINDTLKENSFLTQNMMF